MKTQTENKKISIYLSSNNSYGLEINFKNNIKRYNDLSVDYAKISSFAEKLRRCSFSIETADELIEDFIS